MTQEHYEPINHPVITFTHNWNNKLDCFSFTTFRVHNPKKYTPGQVFQINLARSGKTESKGLAKLQEVKTMTIHQVNDWIARIDTGYSRDEFITMVKTMYKNKGIYFDTALFDLLLLNRHF